MVNPFKIAARLSALLVAAFVLFVPTSSNAQSAVDSIIVVPNPYNISGRLFGSPADPSGYQNVQFANLPNGATIRIYTAAGNHVVTLHHTGGTRYPLIGNSEGTAFNWSGRNADNQYVTSGLYVYVVETPLGTKVGKLIIIR